MATIKPSINKEVLEGDHSDFDNVDPKLLENDMLKASMEEVMNCLDPVEKAKDKARQAKLREEREAK